MFLNVVLPFFVLLSAMVDDLMSKKIHNILILVLLGIVIISVLIIQGTQGFLPILGTFFLSLGITIPLVLLKVIGGGDMKLYAVLAIILPPQVLIYSLIYAFIWGGILGVIKIILDKKLKVLYTNFLSILRFKKLAHNNLHTFPFSVSLFLGWLSATDFVF